MSPPSAASYKYLGVQFSALCAHDARAAELTEKTKTKLSKALLTLKADGETSAVALAGVFGLGVFCAQVLKQPLSEIYYVIKFMRRLSKRASARGTWQDMTAKVWPSIVPMWCTWLLGLLSVFRPCRTGGSQTCDDRVCGC